MYAPRRYYRRLLLPPGWVALGFLLLLGCQALLTHERQMRLPNVLGVTMPELKPDTTALRLYGKEWFIPRETPAEIAAMRPWHFINLVGSPVADFVANEAAEIAVRQINRDTTRAGGVCIRFQQHTTYANMIAALDMMNRLNQKKYFLDIRYKPMALYAITDKPLPPRLAHQPVFRCGTSSCIKNYRIPVAAPTFSQLLASFGQQAWRPSMLLFIVITGSSFYRLACPRRPAR